MNKNKLRIAATLSIAAALAFVACKDQFSEEDFLKSQSELALQRDAEKRKRDSVANATQADSYIKALNAAGDLMSVTLLVRENDQPIEGVKVTITGATGETSGTATPAPLTGTTSADGTVVFPKVTIGQSTIAIAKDGYLPATALVNFGTPDDPNPVVTNGVTTYTPPPKRTQNLLLPAFAAVSGYASTATVKGKVTIET